MKRVLLLIAVMTVLAAGISFAVARWVTARCNAPTVTQLHNAAWLKRELNLTDAQSGEVEKVSDKFQTELDRLCAEHCAARFALGDELTKPQPDVEKCRTFVEKMNAAQADSERMTLAHILSVRTLLNDEQARRYSQIIRDRVCNMPMGAP